LLLVLDVASYASPTSPPAGAAKTGYAPRVNGLVSAAGTCTVR
jgi:hypothetical protein